MRRRGRAAPPAKGLDITKAKQKLKSTLKSLWLCRTFKRSARARATSLALLALSGPLSSTKQACTCIKEILTPSNTEELLFELVTVALDAKEPQREVRSPCE